MPLRISSAQLGQNALYNIEASFARYEKPQTQLTTGKQIAVPSDNPAGTTQALTFQNRIDEINQYADTNQHATGFLSTTETALASVSDLLRQARTIAVQAANDTNSSSSETRISLGNQIQQIITQLGTLGNTTYGNLYVFAGQHTGTQPFTDNGDTFDYHGGTAATGDSAINLDVGRSETIATNVSGDTVFTSAFATLSKLRDDIKSGATDAISGVNGNSDLDNADKEISNTLNVRADIGAKIQRLSADSQRNDQAKTNFTKYLSQIVDTDYAKAAVELQTAQTSYQAAIQTTAKIYQYSLLDFLR